VITPEELAKYAAEFDEVCVSRHEMGAEKYGPVNFLGIDSVEMMIEEVCDLANYARYTYIKLRILQESLKKQLDTPVVLGKEGFSNRLG
jgi:hypothetical protein